MLDAGIDKRESKRMACLVFGGGGGFATTSRSKRFLSSFSTWGL